MMSASDSQIEYQKLQSLLLLQGGIVCMTLTEFAA
jgi:hypothetical protein